MSSSVTPYAALPPIRSSLFHNPPDTLPPADELDILRLELEAFKAQSLERAKKAGDDIRTIEESMRRLKEKEKGKAKAIQKAERERGLTPSVNGDESRASAQPTSQPPRNRLSAAPAPPAPTPTPSFTDVRKSSLTSEELKKNKKKKRKREDSSDIEPDPPKVRKPSPLPPPPPPPPQPSSSTHSHPPPPPKASKFPSASSSFNKPSVAPDFAIPPSTSLLPPRPPVAPRPVAGPSKPAEVTEDFSKSKQPNQVLVTTFYTSIEPWLRPIKEEDIGFLQYTADEVEPFVMPKLGRHYSVQWEEEDIATYGQPLPGTAATRASMHAPPPSVLPRWEPSTLEDEDAALDHHAHGPLTERVASALMPMNHLLEYRGVKATEEDMAGRPGTNGAAAAAARDKLNVADLEERMKHVVRYHGLLDEIPDYSEAVDDPIATALRHAQRELRTVLATNKARRARLAAIAEDRLAYQEYVESRDAIDKSITTLYSKLQKKDGPKVNKKKKQKSIDLPGGLNGTSGPTGTAALPPCPAALGLSPDEHNQLHIPDQLNDLVRTRRNWVDIVGGVFDEKERENPGRIWGFPQESIYQGVDEEVRAQLERLGPAQPRASGSGARVNGVGHAHTNGRANGVDARTSTSYGSKGKARAGDEMDLG
ncbi:histone acetyltransferases subunit 3-domain-containing protein [Cerioporus squamosus]|nr:histone acetyltransferases subunit 3-domain-containing protein [Cerioporus squamosus]KAI0696545.1 histone acetyltransferases subunit 3-domain-containing protein [Cerioporus squamosus]